VIIVFLIITALGFFIIKRQAKKGPGFWLGFLISIGLGLLAFGTCALFINRAAEIQQIQKRMKSMSQNETNNDQTGNQQAK
jgi:hypothetical protein